MREKILPSKGESFGSRLRYYRLRAGLSQLALADQVGTSRGTLYRLEQSVQVPAGRPALVAAIAARLGVTVASLMPANPEPRIDTPDLIAMHWPQLDDESRRAIESTARAVINLHRRGAGLPPI